ncbi:hypothetical protein LEP1GSC037_0872 [Leptospira interrogans str. 2006001854]|uniref:Uncharacterized protein n=1 Tax=Leptospira interrogans str. 2006001854 TaxID=1001590 RepID=M6G813_LEPIR|nr:hypothetical protein LEP1GSC037_0872 [Leptospira interrogans str. 2006001854]
MNQNLPEPNQKNGSQTDFIFLAPKIASTEGLYLKPYPVFLKKRILGSIFTCIRL